MENRAIDISHWDISKVTMKTDALDLRHVDQVLLSIQPETELWTLSSKVFICTPLSLWPGQSICSKELSFEKNHPNSYWTSTVHILRNMNLNLRLHLHLLLNMHLQMKSSWNEFFTRHERESCMQERSDSKTKHFVLMWRNCILSMNIWKDIN